ncbi:MAG: GldG family protein, partial [Acidobacteriota bacterium]
MLRKVVDNVGYAGLFSLFVALFYYSVFQQWDGRLQIAVYGGAGLILVHLVANFSKLRAAMSTRAARYGGAAGLMTLLVLGILVLANFLNVRHHKRVDLTEKQLYSLSEQTRKVIENLETEVEVVGFFRTEPARISFQNFMQEFRYVSSRLNYESVDPEEDPGKTSQYEIQRNGQVVVSSGSKREMVDDYSEEKIINAIIKVTRKEEKVVYFLEGHGERGIQDTEAQGFSLVREAVEKQNYQVKSYNLAQENKVPEDATLLVSAGPKVNFFPNEVNLLQEFLASGGKLLLLVDPDTG